MNSTHQQNKAIGEFVDLIAATVGNNRAIHPETAIASSARLSGSLLMRSFNFQFSHLEPGSVLLSEEANEKGPMLINILSAYLSTANIQLDRSKLGGQPDQKGQQPQLDFLGSISQLQNEALNICKNNELAFADAAQAAALATAFIVKECAPQIGAEVGYNVAVYGFIEGSKTVPPKTDSVSSGLNKPKPWYKFWQ